MKTVEGFIASLDGQQKAIVAYLNNYLIEKQGLTVNIRYNVPMYYHKKWVCYLNPIKKDGIELVFLKGKDLSNVQGLLKSKGRKIVAGIEFFHVNDIPISMIGEITQEALLLESLK